VSSEDEVEDVELFCGQGGGGGGGGGRPKVKAR
jgi:hypothetical protein